MAQDFLESVSSIIEAISLGRDILPVVIVGGWEFLLARTSKTSSNSTIDLLLETLAFFIKRIKR